MTAEKPAPPPVRAFGPFTAAMVRAYAVASADDNPLHLDPALAAKAGLEQPPIHGMLMMACFETYLDDWRAPAKVERLSAKFIRPVLIGEGIEIAGKVVQARSDGREMVRLTVKRGADLVCLAEALIVL